MLGVALIISGTLIFLIGLWAWAYHGYEEDAGTGVSNTLGMGLPAGRRADGLAAIEEAVAVYRRLAAADAAAYAPALATALNKLSLRLAEAGRRDEALAAIEEAVAVYRRLATANAAAYEPALATSLRSLSLRLADAGRRNEAERAEQEAAALSSTANDRST